MPDTIPLLDWVHLPAGTTEQILWESLHDADLTGLKSDLLNRTVQLEFDVPYVRRFHKFPEALKFVFLLSGVHSVRTCIWAIWPGGFDHPKGCTQEESKRLVAEYQDKWREESDSWSEFESRFNAGAFEIEVSNATLASTGTKQLALQLQVRIDVRGYRELFLRFESMDIKRSDGQTMTLQEFMALGNAYWEAFARREI